ncbi:MAG: hypothetical protein J7J86_09790 [Bacteroidales bacterium]|nr:hypothetical protein [Bacteroidales bacterium]
MQDNSEKNNAFLSRGFIQTPIDESDDKSTFHHTSAKLDTYDWLQDIPLPQNKVPFDIIEVRFKNSRKDFYKAPLELNLKIGDIIAVEASPGHDIGVVSMTGELVKLQMKAKKVIPDPSEIKKVYRKARQNDIENWILAVEEEEPTKIKARQIASELNLNMKINDVEYQGNNAKATFYYTAKERVDFRELIKRYAEEFKVHIEMRQIGVRQEACRIGGIGPCGRELCCSTWLTDFKSVSTSAARTQQLSLNPQKLTGQCGKLKCCLNFEYPVYIDALKQFPELNIVLKTKKGDAVYQKANIFKKILWYSYVDEPGVMHPIKLNNVKKIIKLNSENKKPEKLENFVETVEDEIIDFKNFSEISDLDRFNKTKNKKKNKKNNGY